MATPDNSLSNAKLGSFTGTLEEEAANLPATQADLQQYFFKLRAFLTEFKNEFFMEHKRHLDIGPGIMHYSSSTTHRSEDRVELVFSPGTERQFSPVAEDSTFVAKIGLAGPDGSFPVGRNSNRSQPHQPPRSTSSLSRDGHRSGLQRRSTTSSKFSRDGRLFDFGNRKEPRPWKEFKANVYGQHHRDLQKAETSELNTPEQSVRTAQYTDRHPDSSDGSQQGRGSMTKTLSAAARSVGKKQRFSAKNIQDSTKISTKFNSETSRPSGDSSFAFRSSFFNGDWRQSYKLVKRCVKHPLFEIGCGIVICLNACLVGIETEIQAQEGNAPKECDTIQHFLNAWYVVELSLRVTVDKKKFFSGDDANWNLFDMTLVISAFVDLVLSNIQFSGFAAARALRALRLFRIVRTLRIIRQFKLVREFRKMVCSMTSSLSTLFWSLTLVFGIMYSFALWFTQTAAYYRYEDDDVDVKKVVAIDEFYVSLSRTVYSLFAAISGGYSWHVLLDPWVATGDWFTILLFFAYISISVFGLLNIVTSIFVESAMLATKHFQDLLLDEKKKDLEMYTNHMQRIFHVIDVDNGGDINFEEMEKFLNEDDSELRAYLEALGITSSDVWVLFKLLDLDNSGSIDINEFCEGCMRLKGEARSFDINCMMYESRAMLRHSAEFMEFVERKLEEMEMENAQWLMDLDRRFAGRLAALASKLAPSRPRMDAVIESTTPISSPRQEPVIAAQKRGVSMPLVHGGAVTFRNQIQPKTILAQCATVDFSDM